jgi:group I intron endonuclease
MKCYGCVYIHRNKVTDKVYIGQTVQEPERRWRRTENSYQSYRTCKPMFRALKKHTWDAFETTILGWADDQESLNKLEEKYLKEFDCIAPKGYNTKLISEGRGLHSESTKKKISAKRQLFLKNYEHTPFGSPRKWHQFLDDGHEYKNCSACDQWKQLSNFGKDKNNWDGVNLKCKDCRNLYRRTKYPYIRLNDEDWKASYKNRNKKI